MSFEETNNRVFSKPNAHHGGAEKVNICNAAEVAQQHFDKY
jgi:hypothetical protein